MVMKSFSDISMVIGVQIIKFIQQGQRLATDQACHIKCGIFMFSHRSISTCVGCLSELFHDAGQTRKYAYDPGHG